MRETDIQNSGTGMGKQTTDIGQICPIRCDILLIQTKRGIKEE